MLVFMQSTSTERMTNRFLLSVVVAIVCAILMVGVFLYFAIDRSVSRTVAAVEALPYELSEVIDPSSAVIDTAKGLTDLSDLEAAASGGVTPANITPSTDCGWLTGSQSWDADSLVREFQENAARAFEEVGEDLVVCGKVHSVSPVQGRWVIRLGDDGLFGVWVWGETPDWLVDLERGQTASIHCTGYHDGFYGDGSIGGPPSGTLVHCVALYEPD